MSCQISLPCHSENSVPPRKLYSRRSSDQTTPDSGENLPVTMGLSTEESSSWNGNGCKAETPLLTKCSPDEIMPLDFSMKKTSDSCSPHSHSLLPSHSHSFSPSLVLEHFRKFPHLSDLNKEYPTCNGGPISQISSEINNHPSLYRSVYGPTDNVSQYGGSNINRFYQAGPEGYEVEHKLHCPPVLDLKCSTADVRSSPHTSSSGKANSSILEERLTRNPTAPFASEYHDPRFRVLALQGQNPYIDHITASRHAAGFTSPNPGLTDLGAFLPYDLIMQSASAYIGAQTSAFHPLLQSSSDLKGPGERKTKQERPFKAYNCNLQFDDIFKSAPGALPFLTRVSSSPESRPYELKDDPDQTSSTNTSRNPNDSNNSDHACASSETDSNCVPHSSVSNSLPTGETDDNARKRKRVADSQKDESYWIKRQKNNAAAKKSRESRRQKEDQIAEHAEKFKNMYLQTKEVATYQALHIQQMHIKNSRIEKDKVDLMTQNALLAQQLKQQRCTHCGNNLADGHGG